ncbi:carnosine N-methyltransferase-like isoform X2 [Cucumis melo var. makuwa]|uniref:Carnosine N-methyltransferase-like isoform X2 n=1 Tax=Cucumis melo var. makuwa TaxID=1194695 RepID=A0A5A7VCC1_CUCMM|nr:carnosine N-methyltransferase-like isoform X2 [Cucumis melo var. makuwa]TYK28063.1 carnosine N-methyltransferase-like isoform X2 [Cucumis melo var. makuwa]
MNISGPREDEDEEQTRQRKLEEALEVKSLRRIVSAYLKYVVVEAFKPDGVVEIEALACFNWQIAVEEAFKLDGIIEIEVLKWIVYTAVFCFSSSSSLVS